MGVGMEWGMRGHVCASDHIEAPPFLHWFNSLIQNRIVPHIRKQYINKKWPSIPARCVYRETRA